MTGSSCDLLRSTWIISMIHWELEMVSASLPQSFNHIVYYFQSDRFKETAQNWHEMQLNNLPNTWIPRINDSKGGEMIICFMKFSSNLTEVYEEDDTNQAVEEETARSFI